MQYLSPVGGGPSSNTWPRCASQRAHFTSTRIMPWVASRFSATAGSAMGRQKLGQPLPDSYFVSDAKSSSPQHTQR
jgi:hypothetical protein